MIEKIVTNQLPIESGSSTGQPNNAGALPNNDADVSLQVNYASLIEKAIQQPETDIQLVERAREMLLSGQLDTPENYRKVAEHIVMYGI